MANPFSNALRAVILKSKRVLGFLVLWAALCAAAGVAASQFFPDPVAVETIVLATAFTLLFWWALLAWRLKNRWLLELQEFLAARQMLPFNFARFGGTMPWNASVRRERLLQAAAAEVRGLREKVKLSDRTLEKYVGTAVLDKAARKALDSELGGELRRVYVLFSDVRGFTRMTETLRPEETVDILNRMFTGLEEVIRQNGGDINKYIGDAVFAYFRRPYGDEGEAAKKVLRTALRMQDRFEVLNQSFKAAYSRPVEIGLGIGVTAGEAILGNLGSANRMEFTLIGDTVNLASRLCGIAKHGQVLVNGEMARAVAEQFELTALPPVALKGKAEPQVPYAVVGERLGLGR